ncbi:MAG: FKBP-type peptidyl-prolyl cis-trans isomerase [Crocinitomicaceae bacterium]|nr:FKBP-type peptidyl-prolyl cis-trans isomerase [Crocinitomicaceae bacterium]
MRFSYYLIVLLFLAACGNDEQTQEPVKDPAWTKDESIKMNSTFAQEEDEEIENFLSHRPDWKATKTGTGLRYFIYHKSENNDTARVGDLVTVEFNISLLDGTECYSSEENGPESFIVEKTDIESGVHEGMQYMCTGDKAKLILPSHMAHGMIGDREKIPPLTPTVYDITLLEIKRNPETSHE